MDYWCKWALSIYGWKYLWAYRGFNVKEPLKNINNMRSIFRNEEDNIIAATQYLNIKPRDFVKHEWSARLHHPAYFVAMDHKTKNIVLVTRGTVSPFDVMTDLNVKTQDFKGGRVHGGILKSSQNIYQNVKRPIIDKLREHPDYSLILTGHSLGGAVSAVMGHMFNDDNIPANAYCFGTPPIFTKTLATKHEDKIISIINDDDMISSLCVGEQLYLPGRIHHLDKYEIIERQPDDFIKKSTSISSLRNHMPDAYEDKCDKIKSI